MQNVSAADFAKVTALQKISLHCYIDGTALEAPVSSCEYSASVGTEDSFSFGNACAASVSLVVAAPLPGLVGKDIRVTWSVDETEYPLLIGSVEKTTVAAGRTTVEAYDWMYRKGGQPFDASELQETCSAGAVLQKVAALMEVELEPDTLTDAANVTVTDGLKDIAEDTNCAQIAGYVAGLMGKNALINRGGLLAVRGYSNTDFKTEPYSGGAEAQSKDFGVLGITLQRQTVAVVTNPDRTISEEQVTLDYSAGDGSLMVDNPLADQDAADRAYAALATLNYRPGSYSFPGGLLLEPGDLFSVQSMDGTYTAAAVTLNMTIDGGCMTVAAAGGEVTSGGFSGSINQALAAVQVALARFQKVYADNAVITAANIETLRSGKIYSNSVELIPADTSGEADTLGKLVLWGYGAVGTELVEKLVLEVYPYDENNVTPAIIRVPNALNIVQGDTALLMDLSVNSMQVRPQIDAQGGLKAYEDLDAGTGGIMVFNSGNGVTRISTGGSKFTGSIVVDGNYTTEIGDTTKLPPDTYYNGTILPQAFAPAGLIAGDYIVASDTELDTALEAVLSTMQNKTARYIRLSCYPDGVAIDGGHWLTLVYKHSDAYASVTASRYSFDSEGGQIKTCERSKVDGTWEAWYEPKNYAPQYGWRKKIPSGADLNDYVSIGNYAVSSNSTVGTLSNCPTTRAFILNCYSSNGSNLKEPSSGSTAYVYYIQEITDIAANRWLRACQYNAGTWKFGAWKSLTPDG